MLLEVEDWNVWHPDHAKNAASSRMQVSPCAAGEVVGIAGLMGSGRTELAMSIFGRSYGRNISGRIRLRGKPSTSAPSTALSMPGSPTSPRTASRSGSSSTRPSASTSRWPIFRPSRPAASQPQRGNARRGEYRDALAIRTPTVFQKVVNLSGGNQQKVVLSKWLFANPKVLILDEPTRGIDVGRQVRNLHIINKLAADGKGVLMISSEMPELIWACVTGST
jgi:putative multiple sugar transport system ATP-binding protein